MTAVISSRVSTTALQGRIIGLVNGGYRARRRGRRDLIGWDDGTRTAARAAALVRRPRASMAKQRVGSRVALAPSACIPNTLPRSHSADDPEGVRRARDHRIVSGCRRTDAPDESTHNSITIEVFSSRCRSSKPSWDAIVFEQEPVHRCRCAFAPFFSPTSAASSGLLKKRHSTKSLVRKISHSFGQNF